MPESVLMAAQLHYAGEWREGSRADPAESFPLRMATSL
jgi:hypothetical protein